LEISALKIFISAKMTAGQSINVFADVVFPASGMLTSLWLAISLGWQAALFALILLASGISVYFTFKSLRGNATESS
jgi:hypothetical protein